MNYLRFFIIVLMGLMIISCAPVDPSANDLKSPCVSTEFSDGSHNLPAPCIRRSPLGNQFV